MYELNYYNRIKYVYIVFKIVSDGHFENFYKFYYKAM